MHIAIPATIGTLAVLVLTMPPAFAATYHERIDPSVRHLCQQVTGADLTGITRWIWSCQLPAATATAAAGRVGDRRGPCAARRRWSGRSRPGDARRWRRCGRQDSGKASPATGGKAAGPTGSKGSAGGSVAAPPRAAAQSSGPSTPGGSGQAAPDGRWQARRGGGSKPGDGRRQDRPRWQQAGPRRPEGQQRLRQRRPGRPGQFRPHNNAENATGGRVAGQLGPRTASDQRGRP